MKEVNDHIHDEQEPPVPKRLAISATVTALADYELTVPDGTTPKQLDDLKAAVEAGEHDWDIAQALLSGRAIDVHEGRTLIATIRHNYDHEFHEVTVHAVTVEDDED